MLDPEFLQIDPVATPLVNVRVKKAGLGAVLELSSVDRPPPRHLGEVSDASHRRLTETDYRPKTLEPFFP